MKKLLVLAAAAAGAASVLSRRKKAAASDSALWHEAVNQPTRLTHSATVPKFRRTVDRFGDVAQLAEHRLCKAGVGSSIPSSPLTRGPELLGCDRLTLAGEFDNRGRGQRVGKAARECGRAGAASIASATTSRRSPIRWP